MNDVSVLFPVGGANPTTALWPATLQGLGGPLLPRATFDMIGRSLVNALDTADAQYAALRVVSVRFDPCFPAAPCQPQVRLVLQSITDGTQFQGTFFDGAVHLLYNLTGDQFAGLVKEVRVLTALTKENTATAPLGPSPALTAQGLDGAYGKALRALVTRHAGAANLARMTFMTRTLARMGQWEFGGFNLQGFAPTGPIAIVGLSPNTTLQVVTRTGLSNDWGYSLTPTGIKFPAVGPMLTSAGTSQATPAARTEGYGAIVRIENPTLESPETADCASCHLAGLLRRHLDEKYPPSSPPTTEYAGHAEAKRVVITQSAFDADDDLRAFGYFGSVATISQRTANETHAVVAKIAAMYP
jgi:hypothetical protein